MICKWYVILPKGRSKLNTRKPHYKQVQHVSFTYITKIVEFVVVVLIDML